MHEQGRASATSVELRQTEVPMMVCDSAGGVVEASAAARAALQAIGVDLGDPAGLPESLRSFLCHAELGKSQEWSQEPNGSDLALGLTRYRHGADQFVVLVRELSGMRRSLARRLREQRHETVARMSSEIAHEFRNVLATIVYNVDCVLDAEATAPLPPMQSECIQEISAAAKRLGGVIQILLEYGRGEVSRRTLAAPQLLDQVSSFARAALRQRDHQLDTRAEPDLPPMRGNPLVIEQIAINLVTCASTFSSRPMKLLLSAGLDQRFGTRVIAVRLRDNGPGLPQSVRAHIFDPLLEGPAGETGVGLALAREAAASLDGELLVEPSTAGNSFVAYLRVADPSEPPR